MRVFKTYFFSVSHFEKYRRKEYFFNEVFQHCDAFSEKIRLFVSAKNIKIFLQDATEFDSQLAAARQEDAQLVQAANQAKVDSMRPQITNLNEDPMLSGVVHHYLAEGETSIGRSGLFSII